MSLVGKRIGFYENDVRIAFLVKKVIYSNKFALGVHLNLHTQLRFAF